MRWTSGWLILIPLASLLLGCSHGAAPTAAPTVAPTGGPAAVDPALNPHVQPPRNSVTVAPNLAVVTPPAGFLSQQAAEEKGSAYIRAQTRPFGALVLTQMQITDRWWELDFQTDGRELTFGHGPGPRPTMVRKPPIQERLEEQSRMGVLGPFSLRLDGQTGAFYSEGYTSGRPDATRTDLEHYRGRIVTGGAQTVLRLTKPDGTPEGRDLKVWVLGLALEGRPLWHLTYGLGHTLDVWGLTGTQGDVLAYKLTMDSSPPQDLVDLPLVHGIPVPEGYEAGPVKDNSESYVLPNQTVSGVIQWYRERMPKYGWSEESGAAVAPDPADVYLKFRSQAWSWSEVHFQARGSDVAVAVTWHEAAPL